jgi:hypothetical protein
MDKKSGETVASPWQKKRASALSYQAEELLPQDNRGGSPAGFD